MVELLEGIELGREVLANKSVVISNQNRGTETMAILGSIKAGAMFDSVGRFGTAEMVARLLNRGTRTMSSSQISTRIEEMGATLQFSNNDESISFTARCHSVDVEDLLTILAECLSAPSFPSEEVEKVRKEIMADLEAERDETRTTAFRALLTLVYGREMPYGRNPLGTLENVSRIASEDVGGFYRTFYGPDSLILAATGNFEYDEFIGKIEKTLGTWEKKVVDKVKESSKKSYLLQTRRESRLLTVPMHHKTQVDLALGSEAVSRDSSEYYALNLGNLIFGRIGLYGRLGKNIRDEKGLAYYCYSILQSKSFAGHIGVYAGVNPKNVERAIEGITQEINTICSRPLSEEEVLRGRRNLQGALSIALESSSERVSVIHDIEYYGLGLDYLERYPRILNSVNSDTVLSCFSKYLNPLRISLAIAGPINSEANLNLPKKLSEKEEAVSP